MKKSSLLRLALFLALLAAAVVGVRLLGADRYLRDVLEWVKGLGPWGPVALALVYVPACILMVPGTLVTLAGGALFGLVPGIIAVSLGSTAGAGAAFLIGRFVARGWVEQKVAGSPRFRAVDRAIAARGFKIVLLLRLSPVFPFNLLNYALSLTRIPFAHYLLASWIGMFPGTVLYVYLGTLVKDLAELDPGDVGGGLARRIFLIAGLVVTVAVTVYITRVAKKALDEALAAEKIPAGDPHG